MHAHMHMHAQAHKSQQHSIFADYIANSTSYYKIYESYNLRCSRGEEKGCVFRMKNWGVLYFDLGTAPVDAAESVNDIRYFLNSLLHSA